MLALGTPRSFADQRVVARRNHLLELASYSPLQCVASTCVYIFSCHAVGAAALTSVCSVYASIINSTATPFVSKIFIRFILEFLIKFFRCFEATLYTVATSLIGFSSLFWLFDYFCSQYIRVYMYMYKSACCWHQNLICHTIPYTCPLPLSNIFFI